MLRHLIRRIWIIPVLVVGLTWSGPSARAEDWRRIGIQKVSRQAEWDTIKVDKERNFRYIRLRVVDSGVIIERWELVFRDGSVQPVGFFGLASEGFQSPPIPVRTGLKKIKFRYYSVPGPKTARVEVLGNEQ